VKSSERTLTFARSGLATDKHPEALSLSDEDSIRSQQRNELEGRSRVTRASFLYEPGSSPGNSGNLAPALKNIDPCIAVMIAAVATSINDDAVPRVAVSHVPDSITLFKDINGETWEPSLELLSSPRAVFTGNKEISIRRKTRDITFGMNDQKITTLRYDRRRRHDLKANPLDHVISVDEVNDVSLTYGLVIYHSIIIRTSHSLYNSTWKLCGITV